MEQSLFNKESGFITVNKTSLERLVTLVEELVINKIRIDEIKNEVTDKSFVKILDQEIGITSQVQDTVKKMLMVKMDNIYASLIDLVNSYCKEYNVEVELELEGNDTEIENSIISNVTDILKFYIRDMFENDFPVDNNKSYKIKIKTTSDNKNVCIDIESSGNSFDYEHICKTMNKQQLEITSFNEYELNKFSDLTDSKCNTEEMLQLNESVTSIGGSIIIEGEINKCKQVKVVLPVASSIIQALLVKVAEQIYAIPLEYVETIINRNAVIIKNVNNVNVIMHMGHVIKVISIAEVLNNKTCNSEACVLIININGNVVALIVDSLLDQTDIVIKPKPAVIKDIKEFRGTTILGDGLVTLVLDAASIIKEI